MLLSSDIKKDDSRYCVFLLVVGWLDYLVMDDPKPIRSINSCWTCLGLTLKSGVG